jgi:peptide/nickel transport system permease protein
VAFIAFVSFAAPLLGFHNPNEQHLLDALQPPSRAHPMGTDALGRDILTRVVYGGRIDLTFAFVTTIVPFALGVLLGCWAGYRGGWLDTVVNRLVDVVVAFPFIVLILAIVTITGPGLKGAYIGVFAVGWALYARLTRGEMLVEREKEYILAARTLGYSPRRIVLRHALPNVLRASIVFSMADVVLNILLLSSLSYLGLGAIPPSPEWGALVADGKDLILTNWWVATMPGLVIVLTGIAFSLIGDGLADRLGRDFTLTTGGEADAGGR